MIPGPGPGPGHIMVPLFQCKSFCHVIHYNYLPCKKENNVARQEEEEEFLEPLTIIYKNVIVFTFSFCGFLVSLLNRYICI